MRIPTLFRKSYSKASLKRFNRLVKAATGVTTKAKRTATARHASTIQSTLNNAFSMAKLTLPRGASRLPTTKKQDSNQGSPVQFSGSFNNRRFANEVGSRDYKLYVPGSYSRSSKSTPLIVMLHGCTQSPDDFARGTRMNEYAEEHGFLVAYPAQTARANGSRCWNWYSPPDQLRDAGEPSLISGITRHVISEFGVDANRVFIAGLSAGGAMALLMGDLYPELYSGVGIHSGLPVYSANSVGTALKVMSSGKSRGTKKNPKHQMPTLVFHGDRDATVVVENGVEISLEAVQAFSKAIALQESPVDRVNISGKHYSSTAYKDTGGIPRVEKWILHGAPHAWSGGSEAGSFTYPVGVDASREMIRFFFAQTSQEQ